MKISPRTKQILKNFASINQNVLLTQGNKIRTISQAKTVYSEAEVEETFPNEFGIYDLNEFLGVIGLFSDPDIQLDESIMTVSQGKNSVRYLPADSSVLIAPSKPFQADVPVTVFSLEAESISAVLKAAGVLKSPVVTFRGDGSKISLVAHDKTNVNSNSFSVDISDNSLEFEYHVKTEYLAKLLLEKFEVNVVGTKLSGGKLKKVLTFYGDAKIYMIAVEEDSTIEV